MKFFIIGLIVGMFLMFVLLIICALADGGDE